METTTGGGHSSGPWWLAAIMASRLSPQLRTKVLVVAYHMLQGCGCRNESMGFLFRFGSSSRRVE